MDVFCFDGNAAAKERQREMERDARSQETQSQLELVFEYPNKVFFFFLLLATSSKSSGSEINTFPTVFLNEMSKKKKQSFSFGPLRDFFSFSSACVVLSRRDDE